MFVSTGNKKQPSARRTALGCNTPLVSGKPMDNDSVEYFESYVNVWFRKNKLSSELWSRGGKSDALKK